MKVYEVILIFTVLFSFIIFFRKILMYRSSRRKEVVVRLGRKGLFPFMLKISSGHIMVYGKTGMGKSNTAKVLVSELSKRIPVLILDWAGEHNLPNFKVVEPGINFSINPLEPYCREEHIDFLVDLFGDSFNFTEPQRYLFRTALKNTFTKIRNPVLSDVLEELLSIPPRSYYDHEIKMAIIRRLKPLTEGLIGKALNTRASSDIGEIFSKNIIINLGRFRNVRIKKLFLLIILKMLYDYSVMKRGIVDKLLHCTLIEEAWATIPYRRLDEYPSIGERIFAELRKYGECIIGVSQSLSETAWSIAKNSEIIIIHRMFPKDIEVLGIKEKLPDVNELKVGEAYIITTSSISKVKIRKY
ncbi:MAG: hypothetical protein DRJ64_01000 [Thermoprotei archaeon]|nr:MAG: hypothetical protein DRJ64_01000 [Thermoprotei archaeon]